MADLFSELFEMSTLIFLVLASFGAGAIVGTYRSMAEIKRLKVFRSKHFQGVFSFDPLHD